MISIATMLISLLYQNPPRPVIKQKLLVSSDFLNREATLWVAADSGGLPMEAPREAFEKLLLKTKQRQKIIRQLNDLEGAVHINSMAAALQYVRLRTSPSTWYMWHGTATVEVISKKQFAELPNYGLANLASSKEMSGYMGVLSNKDFRQNHFSVASVSANRNGFTILRWLLAGTRHSPKVELIQEEVGFTGKYQGRIIKVKDAPILTGTGWYIPKFE